MLLEFVGEVIRGKGLGRTLGFPTANLSISHALALPYGVYAARVLVCHQWFEGIVNIGKHPTLPDGPPAVEVHIIGFFNDIYGKRITVRLTRFVRKEKKFTTIDALRKQIQSDLRFLQTKNRHTN